MSDWQRDGDRVIKRVTTPNQTAEVVSGSYYRLLIVVKNGDVVNNGIDTETVRVDILSGLDVARGDSPTVLDYDGEVIISVDGQQITKTLTNGSVAFDLTTDKPAGSEIEIVAESLADHPAESDSATIEVTQT